MDTRRRDLTGLKFGRLLVLHYQKTPSIKLRRGASWLCLCDCGNKKVVPSNVLVSGESKSCGCYRVEQRLKSRTKHGGSSRGAKTRAYSSWEHMKARCLNTANRNYKNYGGRGILVCDRWRNSFENFLSDMGNPPSKKHTLDRKDVNANYTPENCKWSTVAVQNMNKRNTVYITYKGIIKTQKDWCLFLGIDRNTMSWRLKYGKTVGQAFEIIDHTSPNYKIQHRELLAL